MKVSLTSSRGRPGSGHGSTRTSIRRRTTGIVAATALAFAGMAAVAPSAMAVHDLGLIELEGDAVTQITDDWDEVCKAVTSQRDDRHPV